MARRRTAPDLKDGALEADGDAEEVGAPVAAPLEEDVVGAVGVGGAGGCVELAKRATRANETKVDTRDSSDH